jgi:hypothetical protein
MKKQILFFLGVILTLGSCEVQGPEYYEDLDLVYTNYDDQYDFSSKGTYAMPDSIVKVTGNLLEGEDPEFVKEPYNTQILQKIEENMTALGWTKVADPASAGDAAQLAAGLVEGQGVGGWIGDGEVAFFSHILKRFPLPDGAGEGWLRISARRLVISRCDSGAISRTGQCEEVVVAAIRHN